MSTHLRQYGPREMFGSYGRQALRFIGLRCVDLGNWLIERSWGW